MHSFYNNLKKKKEKFLFVKKGNFSLYKGLSPQN